MVILFIHLAILKMKPTPHLRSFIATCTLLKLSKSYYRIVRVETDCTSNSKLFIEDIQAQHMYSRTRGYHVLVALRTIVQLILHYK